MHVALGSPSVFFTMTPLDDNSLIMTVYSGNTKKPKHYSQMSKEELKKQTQERSKLRIKYPGLCAYNFEICLNIIIKIIIGWDVNKNCATKDGGIFGIPEAYFIM